MRPQQGLAVDVLLQQALAHHQAEVLLGASPGRVGGLVDDVAQIVQTTRIGGFAGGDPSLPALAALPGAGGEAQDLHLDAAALQRARQDVGADGRHHDRPSPHGARVVQQQGDHRVAERALALGLEAERRRRVGDDARQPRGVEHPFFEVEDPGTVLLGQQAALQLVGQARYDAGQHRELAVQQAAQPVQLHRVAQVGGVHHLVIGLGEDAVEIHRAAVVARLLAVGLVALVQFGAVLRRLAARIGGRALGAAVALLLGGRVVGRALHRLVAFAAVLLLVLVGLVLGFGLLRVGLLLAGIVGTVLALAVAGIEVERAQHLAHAGGEGGLIGGDLGQGVDLAAGLELQRLTHQVQHGAGAVGRALAGQALAHQQRHGLGHRHAVGIVDAQGPGLLQPRQQGGGHVGAHPGQGVGAHRLDPRLLDRVEHLGGRSVDRAQAGVDACVVIGQPQRQPVGLSPQRGAFRRRWIARRMGQGQDAVRQTRAVRAEQDLQLRLLGQGAGGVGQGALEGLGGRVGSGHALSLAGEAGGEKADQAVRRIGRRRPSVSERHSHSSGPIWNRRSHSTDQTSCSAQTATTIAQRAGRSTWPIKPKPRPP